MDAVTLSPPTFAAAVADLLSSDALTPAALGLAYGLWQDEVNRYVFAPTENLLNDFARKSSVPAADFKPSVAQYEAYQSLFDYFNQALFAGRLPQPLLTLSRLGKGGALGFFAPSRWSNPADKLLGSVLHEISLTPDGLAATPKDALSRLVHEMCHLEQQVLGTPPRRNYHDKEFAKMMVAVGLLPSSTGSPGGKQVGQKMNHFIMPDGAFALAYAAMDVRFLLPYRHSFIEDGGAEKPKKTPSKLKYTCPDCGANCWGKPDLAITCADCEQAFTVENQD